MRLILDKKASANCYLMLIERSQLGNYPPAFASCSTNTVYPGCVLLRAYVHTYENSASYHAVKNSGMSQNILAWRKVSVQQKRQQQQLRGLFLPDAEARSFQPVSLILKHSSYQV